MAGRGPKPSERLDDESGSALIEFVVLGLVAQLLVLGASVPLLVQQQHQVAAVTAAKLLGRATAAGVEVTDDYVESVSQVIASNFGLQPEQVRLSVKRRGGGLASVRAVVDGADFSYNVRVPR